MKALILAAGQGRRLLPLTADRPKCLVEFGGRSLLQWQLMGLAAAGVDEVVIVTGFKADRIDEMLRTCTPQGLKVRTLYNPFFEAADNLASCWIARHELVGDCLILNGDTLFEPAVAQRLMATAPRRPITVTIDRKAEGYDDDDMKVKTSEGNLLAIGKKLPMEQVDGESIGFLRFTPAGMASFVAEVERIMRTPAGLTLWYLSVIDQLARSTAEVGVLSIEGLQWGELDFPADVEFNSVMVKDWPQ